MSQSSASTVQQTDALILRTIAKATVSARIRTEDDVEVHHITEGQFMEGSVPAPIEKRFDFWENLAVEEPRVIPLPETETTVVSTVKGRAEVQVLQDRKGLETVRVVFHDGECQKYKVRPSTKTVEVPVEAPPERDDEARLILQHYLGVSLSELRLDTSRRDSAQREKQGDSKILREMKRSMREGVVYTDDGRRVEPDHPDSPLRKGGYI